MTITNTLATSSYASAARAVLERAEYILTELRAEPKGVAWEAKLSASLALLRSVGHVLDKTDGKRDALLKKAAKNWWEAIKAGKPSKKPRIFWGFIEKERNLILKEGELRADQSAMVEIVGVQAWALVAGQAPPPPSHPKSPKTTYTYRMNKGLFTGYDPRDLIADAIEWWLTELESIEKNANALSSSSP